MERWIVVGITALALGGSLQAQGVTTPEDENRSPMARLEAYQHCDLRKLEHNLLVSLTHNVEGVVTSALREVAKIKLAQPGCASDRIRRRVEALVEAGGTPGIRHRAYLTSIVLSAPELFGDEGTVPFPTDEEFFAALARKVADLALRDERG